MMGFTSHALLVVMAFGTLLSVVTLPLRQYFTSDLTYFASCQLVALLIVGVAVELQDRFSARRHRPGDLGDYEPMWTTCRDRYALRSGSRTLGGEYIIIDKETDMPVLIEDKTMREEIIKKMLAAGVEIRGKRPN